MAKSEAFDMVKSLAGTVAKAESLLAIALLGLVRWPPRTSITAFGLTRSDHVVPFDGGGATRPTSLSTPTCPTEGESSQKKRSGTSVVQRTQRDSSVRLRLRRERSTEPSSGAQPYRR